MWTFFYFMFVRLPKKKKKGRWCCFTFCCWAVISAIFAPTQPSSIGCWTRFFYSYSRFWCCGCSLPPASGEALPQSEEAGCVLSARLTRFGKMWWSLLKSTSCSSLRWRRLITLLRKSPCIFIHIQERNHHQNYKKVQWCSFIVSFVIYHDMYWRTISLSSDLQYLTSSWAPLPTMIRITNYSVRQGKWTCKTGLRELQHATKLITVCKSEITWENHAATKLTL